EEGIRDFHVTGVQTCALPILLDGVPLNDPFGGWVAWTKLPKLSLASAEIVRGGGSGAWGNAALGGTVQLLTRPPAGNRFAAEALDRKSVVEGKGAARERGRVR